MNTNFWKDRPVLITGATGLLGSALTRRLVTLEADVVAIVRDGIPRSPVRMEGLLDQIKVVNGDLTDLDLVLRIVNEYEVESVFHLAAQTIVRIAQAHPLGTLRSNIVGTWNVLEAARQCPRWVKRIVVASSDKAYGAHEVLPYCEDAPLQGRNPYDVSKSCADLIAQSYHASYGLPICVTRLANIFGPGDLNFSRLIPDTLRSLLQGKRPIIRSDGTPVRDYLFVEDAASAYLHLAEAMERPEIVGQAFNFGNGRPMTVRELVDLMIEVSGVSGLEPDVQGAGVPAGEIAQQYLSTEKAQTLLAWEPETSLEEALAKTYEWYKGILGGRGEVH